MKHPRAKTDRHLSAETLAKASLRANDRGQWTVPNPKLYPHQWLWDSCFVAIGLRHSNPQRAAQELLSLLRGQWSNGMLPHIIFTPRWLSPDSAIWDTKGIAEAPSPVRTSGITQPPLLAEASLKVADKLPAKAQKDFLHQMVPALIRYHEWLYRERDPDGNGLVALIHPWETGLDNSPSWMRAIRRVHTPKWLMLSDWLHLDYIINHLRRDTKYIPTDQRMKTADLLRLHHAQQDLRRRHYRLSEVMQNPHRHFIVESLSFNCILIRNNQLLLNLAAKIDTHVPAWLRQRFKIAASSIEELCDPQTGLCYHRNVYSQKTEAISSISQLLPLYSGAINRAHAKVLVELLLDRHRYWLTYPVPSVPKNSGNFSDRRYWQGPTWLNTNWLLCEGLKNYGYFDEAEAIRESSLALVERSGCREYFSPLTGEGYGAHDFSWTAGLYLDFLHQN